MGVSNLLQEMPLALRKAPQTSDQYEHFTPARGALSSDGRKFYLPEIRARILLPSQQPHQALLQRSRPGIFT
jgi:hypothetical protein